MTLPTTPAPVSTTSTAARASAAAQRPQAATRTTSDPARLWALVACAGTGARSGAPVPKQYQPVAGKPLVLHTLAAFCAVEELAGVVVVVSPGDTFFQGHAGNFGVADCGGATRAKTVLGGLEALRLRGAQAHDWVLVHDAARCLITPAQIMGLVRACRDDAVGGLLALRLPDTLKRERQGRVVETVDRSDKWLAQTPQMFRCGALLDALRAAGDAVTDESSAMEAQGHRPLLVEGSAHNFKVTYPADFALAEALLQSRAALPQPAVSAPATLPATSPSAVASTPRFGDTP